MIVFRVLVSFFFISINFIGSWTVFFTGASCLQIMEFAVPEAVKMGEDHQLICQYQLSSAETLYFLRWYKDGNEFFRYMPKETPAHRVYNVSGVRIKTQSSSSTNVLLTNVDAATSGLYRCEVSAEAPGFETADREAQFHVIEGPKGYPFVTVSKGVVDESTVNETIIANCSGMEATPAPQLSWSLASIPIPTEKEFVTHSVQNGIIDSLRLKRTSSTLRLPMYWIASFIEKLERTRRLSDFIQGHFIVIPLRCTSHILGLFEESDTSDIRVLRHLSSTTSPAVPGNRVAVKLAKPSPNSSAAGANTRHGAFTNGSSSIARILDLTLMGIVLTSSTWFAHHC
ncbi:hypothetical protein OUZ56_016462 [Daphnia magna]|uniref:Ig-like domain-containing protein n=1 Tax=Daphnia magna TaxID=35525 RepID=A0ABR0AQQ1_9CRUS|nr:hypothetical protein OUZ56_016462 [Daphnia magna]